MLSYWAKGMNPRSAPYRLLGAHFGVGCMLYHRSVFNPGCDYLLHLRLRRWEAALMDQAYLCYWPHSPEASIFPSADRRMGAGGVGDRRVQAGFSGWWHGKVAPKTGWNLVGFGFSGLLQPGECLSIPNELWVENDQPNEIKSAPRLRSGKHQQR